LNASDSDKTPYFDPQKDDKNLCGKVLIDADGIIGERIPANEERITLSKLYKEHSRRFGCGLGESTMYGWFTRGIAGRRMRFEVVPGRGKMTTVEEFERFLASLTVDAMMSIAAGEKPRLFLRKRGRMDRRCADVDVELGRMGVM